MNVLPRARIRSTAATLRVAGPGFTLLEIILALAILAGSLAALGEVMRLADESAARTRDATQAQIIAASIVDELVSGARALTNVNQAVYDPTMDDQWLYSVTLEPTNFSQVIAAHVLVEQQGDARLRPARCEVIRWLPNPDFVPTTSATGGTP